jgi:hypothetical protein
MEQTSNNNVNNKIDQLLNLPTVVYADGYKCVVQSSAARTGLLHLSNRYKILPHQYDYVS